MNGSAFESTVLKVGQDLRIRFPQSFVQRVGWITGDQPIDGWLLVGSAGRCRLLSAVEVEDDPNLKSLGERISAELDTPNAHALEFRDAASLALALRLVPVQLTPPEPGWRLALPKPIAAIMQVHRGASDIAVLLLHGHIELWSIETLRSSVDTPLAELI